MENILPKAYVSHSPARSGTASNTEYGTGPETYDEDTSTYYGIYSYLGSDGGGIAIRNSSDSGDVKYFNTVTNNQFYGPANLSSPAIYGIVMASLFSDNIFYTSYGIELNNCGHNTISDNFFHDFRLDSGRYAFKETGAYGYNLLSNIYAYDTYIYMGDHNATSNSRVTNSWNNTVWIDRFGYGS